MDKPNAFVGKTKKPTAAEIQQALGKSAAIWQQLILELTEKFGIDAQEWKSSTPKNGWALRMFRKGRAIVYLAPCGDCFRASLTLRDDAVAAALQAKLPRGLAETILESPKYPEGTGVRLLVRNARDLPAVRALIGLKLAN